MGRHSGPRQTGYQSHGTGPSSVGERWSAEWGGVSAAALLELPVEAENRFVPTPGYDGFGAVHLTEPLTSPLERVNPNVCWWEEGDTLADLGWAVEEIFLDPTPTAELVRPFVGTDEDPAARWADEAPLPPPRPVDGASRRDLASRQPTRRELRERRRRESSLRWITKRRLAKGSVLAVTAFGVVAYSVPQVSQVVRGTAVSQDAAAGAAAAAIGVPAAVTSSAPAVDDLVAQDDSRAARANVQASLRRMLLKEAADAQAVTAAASKAGAVAAAAAKLQAEAAKKERAAVLAAAQRNAIRDPRAVAQAMVADRGWSSAQFTCLNKLWNRESMWRWNATNPSSGAYGIPQSLPASKMASAGADWRTNPVTQIKWGLNYIADRYGTPCKAWAHSEATGWY